MARRSSIEPRFVDTVPAELSDGILYVSMTYATTVHLCACGCGNKVVLPLSPAEWTLLFDGESVSMTPSVGNWEYPCRSHYWIRRNAIQWAKRWTQAQVATGRRRDAADLNEYHARSGIAAETSRGADARPRAWRRTLDAFRRLFVREPG